MRNGTILIVDDSPLDRLFISECLKDASYEVVCLEDGTGAIDLLERDPRHFDALVLDRLMPGLDGLALLGLLKRHPRLTAIPVIMQTSASSREEIVEGLNAGAHNYLTKPYTAAMLVAAVSTAVNDRRFFRNLQEELEDQTHALDVMLEARFEFRTFKECTHLVKLLAQACPDPGNALIGLSELLLNALEHGNLGITYEEKTRLHETNQWREEIDRRQALPENRHKKVLVHFQRLPDLIRFTIRDEGPGFDFQAYLRDAAQRILDNHGRGISMARMFCFEELQYLDQGRTVMGTIRRSRED